MNKNKLLGKGKFGKVIEIEDANGEKVALKMISLENLNLVEIDILARVKSPYLIRSIEELDSVTDLGIKMELKENNLSKLNTTELPHGQIKRIIMNLLYGLECLHKSGFLHLDLKPDNCLYDYKNRMYTAYISDFGFSLRCQDPYKGIVRKSRAGSLKYFPYEFLNNLKEYDFNDKSDVWSLGITILVFLGLKYTFNFSIESTTEEKISKVKNFWDSYYIEKIIDNTLDNIDLPAVDKIDLSELLYNMLQKDKSSRISSKDFNKLRFYNNNTLENSCYISKPKEILYIPYSSTNVLLGIKNINYFFETKFPSAKPEVYFLSIEIFVRLMAITPMQISRQTLESHIQKSFLSAMKYYKQIKTNIKELGSFRDIGYDIAKYLKGDIAPNKYFYKAVYEEDLILLKEVLFSNYHLISLYSYMDSQKLFDYFRQNYNYKNIPKEEIKNTGELFDKSIPLKNTDKAIENDRGIFSYKNLQTKTELYEEENSVIEKFKSLEKEIISSIEEVIKENKEILNKDAEIFSIYKKYFRDKNLEIIDIFKKSNVKNLEILKVDYAIIKENLFDNLEHTEDVFDKDYIIFKDRNFSYSIIYRDNIKKEFIHYFSNFNENLYNFFKANEPNMTYGNNFDLNTNNICKINEICILFIIDERIRTINKNNFNIVYLKDKTLKYIMELANLFQ